jgi:hypothetical protein
VPPKKEPEQPAPAAPAQPQLTPDGVRFPAAVLTITAAGGGRYLVYQLTNGELVIHDLKAGKVLGTLRGHAPDAIIAASRDRLFVGRREGGQVESYNLRGVKGAALVRGRGGAVELTHLAVGSASDGPLVMVVRDATQTQIRLLDIDAFAELRLPVDDPALKPGATFPVSANLPPDRVAVSADGRTIMLSNRWLVLDGDRYKGGVMSTTGWFAPTPDGLSFLGAGLYGASGQKLAEPALPAGRERRYFPAPGGPFVVSAEYSRSTPPTVKLFLHLGANPQPLGELPGSEAITEWAAADPQWVSQLAQRLVFVPDPGAIVFVPPDSDRARVFPVDLVAMLPAGRDVLFTSLPPAFLRFGRPYHYQLSAVARQGPVRFRLEDYPSAMMLNKDGLITWASPGGARPYDIRVSATDGAGHKVVQQFRLVLKNDQVALGPPKKGPPKGDPPRKDPEPNPFDPSRKDPPQDPVVVAPPPKEPPEKDPPNDPVVVAPPPKEAPKKDPPGDPVAVAPPKVDPPNVDPPKADPPRKEEPAGPKTLRLPASLALVAVGGDGRFLVMHLPKVKQLAIFDAKEGKVVKYLAANNEKVLLAAGRDHLFVINPATATLQRWSFAKFEKEATVKLPEDGPFEMALMGSGSTGPLLLCPKGDQFGASKPLLFNPISLRAVPVKDDGQLPGGQGTRVSADGQTFTWQAGFGFQGVVVVTIAEGKASVKTFNSEASYPVPGPGGRYYYAADGVYSDQMQRVHPAANKPRDTSGYVPAVHGNLFLRVTPPARARFPGDRNPPGPATGAVDVFFQGQFTPVATFPDLKGFGGAPGSAYLIPRHHLLVLVGENGDELILHRFDLDALLAKSDTDYLIITSDPPAVGVAGTKFEYAPAVKSKKGGVKIKLDAGPEGMKLGADGKLTWDVPAYLVKQEVSVILTVSDSSGQEVFHTFKVPVVAPPTEKP